MTAVSSTGSGTDEDTTTEDVAADATEAATGTRDTQGAEDAEGAEGVERGDTDGTGDGTEADEADETDAEPLPAAARVASGVGAGAAAVVGAALGLVSLTGTWLGDLMSARQELIGQIDTSGGSAADQVEAVYGTPWHTVALFNGLTALLAVLVSAAVLLRPAFGDRAVRPVVWVRAVATAGAVLGALGLLVAGVMYFDVFTDLPEVPAR